MTRSRRRRPGRYDRTFVPTRPREARGGIKAHSRRGSFGRSWWARRWIGTLEGFDIGERLERGRVYARRGQVLSIEVEKGTVTARVQGSRPAPYQVGIRIKTLSRAAWTRVTRELSRRAIFAARLLAGEMPENIEEVFGEAGLSLFPDRLNDLWTDCSCPDVSNPCKHVAAVYYLLGEEFDRDPFLIFRMRGLDRDELMELLRRTPSRRGRGAAATPAAPPEPAPPTPEPLPADPAAFWGEVGPDDAFDAEAVVPETAAALPRRLGGFPFWRGREDFLSALDEVYRDASSAGVDLFLGRPGLTEEE